MMLAAVSQTSAASESCNVDRREIFRLDIETFDQDPQKGWRALAARPQCREAAAKLIAQYRTYTEARVRTLIWHEAQVRADNGETETAIALMERAKHGPLEHGINQDDWNAYVDATIAFLRGDRASLLKARERLASFPWPVGYSFVDEKGVTHRTRPPNWPANLNVVDGLIRCFGHPYAEAYRQTCDAKDPNRRK